MNRLLFSAALGAATMYFLDPQAGRRRRARTRARAERAARRLQDAYDVTLRDARHRAMGMRAEVGAVGRRLRGEPVDDETLVGRVRAVLGRYVSHPHAIEVTAAGGEVSLAGPILANQVPSLMGMGPRENGIEVQKTICVNAPVEQVFGFWSDYQNFPHFMSRVREVRVDGDRSHWVVEGPAGVAVEWDAEVVASEPNSFIEWRSTPDSAVQQE